MDFFLEPAPMHLVRVDLDFGINGNLPYEVHCLVISEFDTDTLLINDSYIDLSLSEGSYQLVVSPTGERLGKKSFMLIKIIILLYQYMNTKVWY